MLHAYACRNNECTMNVPLSPSPMGTRLWALGSHQPQALFPSPSALAWPDPPVQEVQFVQGGQPRSNLASHPLQQQGLRRPPWRVVLTAQVSLQVTLQRQAG